jgi:hypothetical protein
MQNFTPIDAAVTRGLKYGEENEILIKVSDRYWLPSAAAGGTDKEKEHYLPGIWDDVSLSFTNKLRLHRVLVLPILKEEKVTIKVKIWNLNLSQMHYGDSTTDSLQLEIKVFEKKSKLLIAEFKDDYESVRDRRTEIIASDIHIDSPHPWSPEDPFLYTAEISVYYKGELSDKIEKNFGMRDFEQRGKFFYLNDKKTYLRGSNITLQRFFEDPDSGNLAWDREWVKKMFIDISKDTNWNTMRICVGLVPDFWYDLADEHGLLLQNEWMYWQKHGWNEQIEKEYTDWVWADGSHPSIVIWDAINENRDDFIGNVLVPKLKKLDPTRIWDTGYMTSEQMIADEMDEPHPYMGNNISDELRANPYPLGNLNYKPEIIRESEESSSAQLVNEYGWVWLWRDGTPSKLTVPVYDYYLGKNSTVAERRNFQAYWLQLETEWLRSNRAIAGVLAFTHLTNNYGYTGDWFIGDIKDLTPSPALGWLRESFEPTNVFINLTDERYAKVKPTKGTGDYLNFTLLGINDVSEEKNGVVEIRLLDSSGKEVFNDQINITLPGADKVEIAYGFQLPKIPDGYLLITEFQENGSESKKLSRRYIKIGKKESYDFFNLKVPESRGNFN